jgi:hypothetical protein
LLALALLGLFSLPGDANAAYPGQNGKIAYAVVGGLKTMNPDGSGQAQLTTGEDLDPVWSPNGQQVAFVRGRAAIHVVNADGTGETPGRHRAPTRSVPPPGRRTVSGLPTRCAPAG